MPPNVTVRQPPQTPRLPATLVRISSDLADLVDFHDADFSGPGFDTSDAMLHIGGATAAGRELLVRTAVPSHPRFRLNALARTVTVDERN